MQKTGQDLRGGSVPPPPSWSWDPPGTRGGRGIEGTGGGMGPWVPPGGPWNSPWELSGPKGAPGDPPGVLGLPAGALWAPRGKILGKNNLGELFWGGGGTPSPPPAPPGGLRPQWPLRGRGMPARQGGVSLHIGLIGPACSGFRTS